MGLLNVVFDINTFDFKSLVEPNLLANFDDVKKLVIDNKQPFGMLIDGIPGMSKTTSAAIIARCFQPNFDEDNQIGQGIDNFIKAYTYTIDGVKSKYKVCIYDEANDSDRSGSVGRINRTLQQMLSAASRQERVIIIVILHRFYRLDKKFVGNSLVHMLLHFHSKSNDKYVKFNAYDIDCMLWMLSQYTRGKVLKEPNIYKLSAPNFGGAIKAPPLEYIDYMERISKKGKDYIRKKATRDILSNNYYTVSALASMLQVTKSMVNYQIEVNDFKKAFLREKSGRIFYYDKELFAILKKLFLKIDANAKLKDELKHNTH